MQLRDYQSELLNDLRAAISKGSIKPLAVLPPGAGKTVIFAYIAHQHVLKGGYVHFYVHRRELLDQTLETFSAMNIPTDNIYVGTVQRRTPHDTAPTMIIFDEAHHATAKQWSNIVERWPEAWIVGLTATPVRLDGAPLNDIFDTIVEGVDAEWLIANGWLSDYDYYAPSIASINPKDILINRGADYDGAAIGDIMLKNKIYGDVMKYIDPQRKNIIYAPSVALSQDLADNIPNSAHLDASTPAKERRRVVKAFKSGKIRVLTNVDLFGEGFDVPDADVAILLRPTKSTALFIQQAMRVLRPMDGKRATIYDLVGNVFTHGLPTMYKDWQLEGRVKRTYHQADEVEVRMCKNCLRVYKGIAPECPYCKNDNGQTRAEIKAEEEAELERIKREAKRRRNREEWQAQTLEELIALGKKRGYKNPRYWADKKMKGRKRRI